MSNELSEWGGAPPPRQGLRRIPQPPTAIPLAGMAIKEGTRRPLVLAVAFAAIALAVLALGLASSKQYTSTATVRVQDESIIQPLMDGRVGSSAEVDHAGIAREIAFSTATMDGAIDAGGWSRDDMTPLEIDQLRKQIVARTEVFNPLQNANLIKISYADSDPERARKVAQHVADAVIATNLKNKASESRTAYEFIDAQARQYEENLVGAEHALASYYRQHPEALPGTSGNAGQRISELQRETDRARMDAIDQRAQASVLQSHLSRESSMGASGARAVQIQQQLGTLQGELDTLRQSYTEQHPDVRRVRNQIEQLTAELRRERRSPSASVAGVPASQMPAYSDLRAQLANARSRSAASAERVAMAERLIAEERERGNLMASMEGELAGLQRDYDTSKTLYDDMVARREAARLSMLLDAQHGDLSFRIQEAAALPLQPAGLRLMHVALGGLLLALAIPVLGLLAWVKFDPRVRSASQIESVAGLPVIGTVPVGYSPSRMVEVRKHRSWAVALVVAVPVIFLIAMVVSRVSQ